MATASTLTPNIAYNQANTIDYAVQQALLKVNTILPCKIIAITGATYTVQPLTNIIDANKNPHDSPYISNVPYAIECGGNAGFIIELAVDDAVLVGFAQRDIGTVKKSWLTSNPASFRKFSYADAIIIKKLSNTLPSIFVKVTAAGIEITAPSLPVTVNAAEIKLGTAAANKVLLEGVSMGVTIAGVQAGSGVTTTMTVNSGGSSIVKGVI